MDYAKAKARGFNHEEAMEEAMKSPGRTRPLWAKRYAADYEAEKYVRGLIK
jgi:hypothetical protein